MWKKDQENYQKNNEFLGQSGLQIKVVDSPKIGPSTALRNALWYTGDTKNTDVSILWE